MNKLRDLYCVHCPITGGTRLLGWPLQLLIRHRDELALAGVVGLLVTLLLWMATLKAPPVRQCSAALLAAMARGREPMARCRSSADTARQGASPLLPPVLGAPLNRSPSPSVLRRGSSGD